MATKGFNIKTNLGGHRTISSPLGTFQKNGPAYKPRTKQAPAKTKPNLGAAPAPNKPLGPGAAVGQHAAPDSLYNQQIDTAGRQESSKLAQLSGNEQSIRHDFGIDDPTNPFSRVEGQKRAFLAKQKAASTLLASQGQLYTGTHERAVARTRLEEEQARAGLRQQYDAAINQIGAQKAGVKFDTEEQRAQAFEDWLARAPEAEDMVPQAGGAAGGAAAPVASAAGGAPVARSQSTVTGSVTPAKVNRAGAQALANRIKAQRTQARQKAGKPGVAKGPRTVGVVGKSKGGTGSLKGFGPVKPKAPKVKAKGNR